MRLARLKATAVAVDYPESFVLGADTIGLWTAYTAEAEDRRTAEQCLVRLSGQRHRVYTAVCCDP